MSALEPEHNPLQPEVQTMGFDPLGRRDARHSHFQIHFLPEGDDQAYRSRVRPFLQDCGPQFAAIGHDLLEPRSVSFRAEPSRSGGREISITVHDETGRRLEGEERRDTWSELRDRLEAVDRDSGIRGEYLMTCELRPSQSWPPARDIRVHFVWENELRELGDTGDCGACKIVRGEGSPDLNISCIRAQMAWQLGAALTRMESPPNEAVEVLAKAVLAEEKYYPAGVRFAALSYVGSLLGNDAPELLCRVLENPAPHPSGFGRVYDRQTAVAMQIEVCRIVRVLMETLDDEGQRALRSHVKPQLEKLAVWFDPPVIGNTVEKLAEGGQFHFGERRLDGQVVATLLRFLDPSIALVVRPDA